MKKNMNNQVSAMNRVMNVVKEIFSGNKIQSEVKTSITSNSNPVEVKVNSKLMIELTQTKRFYSIKFQIKESQTEFDGKDITCITSLSEGYEVKIRKSIITSALILVMSLSKAVEVKKIK